MLSAIPVYLAIADGGFAGAASREMGMRSGAGDRAGALAVFQSTAVLLFLVSAAILGIAGPVAWIAPLGEWFGFREIGPGELRTVLVLLLLHVLIGFQGGLLNGGFWCTGRYPVGMVLSSTTMLLEFLLFAMAVVGGGGPVEAAGAFLGGRALGTLLMGLVLRREASWLRYGYRKASLDVIHRLAAPAFASLAFPMGNALNIQGLRLVVGLVLGPAAVAVFVPLRTLSNLVLQPRAVINRLMEPELAMAHGRGDKEMIRYLFLRSCQASLWLTLLLVLLLAITGEWLISVWTQGNLVMNWPLYLLLLASTLINAVWYAALMVPYATNRHGRIAIVYCIGYGLVALSISYPLTETVGVSGSALALLAAELLVAMYVIRVALAMSGVSGSELFATVLRFPVFLFSPSAWRVQGRRSNVA